MRILSKTQISTDSAFIRKQQIDEGVAVAKKVDAMRQELANFQKQRTDFVEGSKQAIEEQLAPYLQKLEYLKREIHRLEKMREELRKPLDAEWEVLEIAKIGLKKKQSELAQEAKDLSKREVYIDEKEEESNINLEKVKVLVADMLKNAINRYK